MNKKLSEIMIEMGKSILKNPDGIPSSEAAHAVLFLANVAWNTELGKNIPSKLGLQTAIDEFEGANKKFWSELKSTDTDELILGLRQFKKDYYPNDTRVIVRCGTNQRGNIQVEWE